MLDKAKTAFWVAATVVMLVLLLIFVVLIPSAFRVNEFTKLTLSCKGNPNCLESMIRAIGGSIRTASGEVAKAAPQIAQSVKVMTDNSAQASEESIKLTKQATTVVIHVDDLVKNANGAVTDARKNLKDLDLILKDLHRQMEPLMADGDESVKSLKKLLDQTTALEVTLQQQIESGSQDALKTLVAIRKLAESPEWEQTLQHIEQASGSGAEIMKTVDQSTRFLRKKVGQLRYVLTKIAQGVKIAINPF